MRVNEIFYSIQGEGANTGKAAIFVRLSGCNLRCDFCDTDHLPYDDLTEEEIISCIEQYPASLVVITGGEPTLQLTSSLVEKIHRLNKIVAIETNGTREIPEGVDWVTVSPKSAFVGEAGKPILRAAEEVKIVFDGEHMSPDPTCGILATHYFIQPCDTQDEERNREIIQKCIQFIKDNPLWQLSLQTHKLIGVR